MIPCSNCKYFDTDWNWGEDGDEYEFPICIKNCKLCLSNGDKCENQLPWKQESRNKWEDWFEDFMEENK